MNGTVWPCVYACAQMMRQRPDLPLRHAVMAFPFLRFDLTSAQERRFHVLFAIWPIVWLVVFMLSCLPMCLQHAMVRLFAGIDDPRLVSAAAKALKPSLARNALSMGREEFSGAIPRAFPVQVRCLRSMCVDPLSDMHSIGLRLRL
jgi:hypothetical protein